ncbi:MAG: TMEM14 family protein, partial [Spirulinaceae cyanobacterium]
QNTNLSKNAVNCSIELPESNLFNWKICIVFALRLKKTRKFMPAGLMLGAGVVTLVCLIGQIM